MRFIVISGMSGAGKMTAYHYFADIGYFAADNLPPRMLPGLADWGRDTGCQALLAVVDARCGPDVLALPNTLAELQRAGVPAELIFLDATDTVLVRRYKETRRPHAMFSEGQRGILEAVHAERALMDPIVACANKLIDTSDRTPSELRAMLAEVTDETLRKSLVITVESFGFKYGVPVDADLVFDVRFLVNPHYVPELKPLTGAAPEVSRYIHQHPLTEPYLEKLFGFVAFSLPHYQREGKAYLTVAIGCTGGRHRSVAVSEDLAGYLRREGYRVTVYHRDVDREEKR